MQKILYFFYYIYNKYYYKSVILWPSGLKSFDTPLVIWQVLILTSILFTLFTFLSKALLHYIDDTNGLSRKMLYNICNLEGIFPLINMYATQVI